MANKNTNGLYYELIEQTGDYTLFKEVDRQYYVVAYCTGDYDDGISWSQGHYFTDIESALKCYKEKTK